MAYVGTPLDTTNAFQSLAGKRFSGDNSTTGFTLDSAPSSTLDLEVFVDNVRQDPNSAYTVSGTTLTFTAAPPTGTNNIYVVHQAKSVGTIDVPSASVQSGSLNSAFFTGATDIGAAIADADLFLVDDGAGGTFRKTAASRIATYIGKNTPSFLAYADGNQSIGNASNTLVDIDAELFDVGANFDTSAKRFTVTEAGYYYIFYQYRWETATDFDDQKVWIQYASSTYTDDNIISTWGRQEYYTKMGAFQTRILAVGDTLDLYAYQNSGGSVNISGGDDFGLNTFFGAFKLIGT
jgi:hypothetical protein